MKKFLLVSPKNRTVYNFRGDLIRDIRAKGYNVVVTGPNRDHIDRIEALGARFIEIPMDKTGINILSDLRYLWRLFKVIRQEKPDITLGYTIKPVIYGSIAACLAGVPNRNSMITGAGYLFTGTSLKAKILRTLALVLYRIGLGCVHRVIFQNPDDRAEFVSKGLLPASKCRAVNGSGVNMEHFAPRPLPAQLTFFMLSRVLFSKGIREYLQAAERVKSRHGEVRFMLLGAVEHMPDSLTMSDLQPYIDAGVVDYFGETSDVRDYIGQCSVFVLPSYREGTPRTVLEAMAMRRAILTTDVPGCRETVVPCENGFLVPAGNADALAERMIWFIEHPGRIEEMAERSLELCREKYEIGRVNRTMLEIMNVV